MTKKLCYFLSRMLSFKFNSDFPIQETL